MKAIRFGLAAVKGCGEGVAEAIEASRPHASLYDVCSACPGFNKGTLEALTGAGALDGFGLKRSQLVLLYDQIQQRIKYDKKQEKKAGNTPELFDMSPESFEFKVEDVPEWPEATTLFMEKEALGFYVSGHPIEKYREVLAARRVLPIEDVLMDRQHDDNVCVAGIVSNVIIKRTREKDSEWAICFLEDQSGEHKLMCFTKAWEEYGKLWEKGRPLLVEGRVNEKEGYDKTIVINKAEELTCL